MRKCMLFAVAALAAFFLALPGQVSAQGIFLGGGATIPSSDYGEYANVGYMFEAGFNVPLGESGLFAFVDGLYGANGHDDSGLEGHDGDSNTKLLGGFGGLEFSFADEGEAGPFVFGQVGYLRHTYNYGELSESEGALAYGGGVGYGMPLNESINGWVLGRYLTGSFDEEYDGFSTSATTAFIGIMAGVSFALGG